MVWLLIVVLLVVLAILWLFRKRWRRNKAIQILLYHSQRLTDQAMAEALQQLGISTDKPMTSKPIADIWGHGVMAFSYQISSSLGKVTQPALEQALRQAARQLDIASSDPALPPFVLTDFFELEGSGIRRCFRQKSTQIKPTRDRFSRSRSESGQLSKNAHECDSRKRVNRGPSTIEKVATDKIVCSPISAFKCVDSRTAVNKKS